MVKPELEKKLFLHLMKVEFSTLDEMIKLFQCTRESLINIIESNTKTKTVHFRIAKTMHFRKNKNTVFSKNKTLSRNKNILGRK